MTPFLGRPNSRAGAVEMISTNRFGLIFPVTTPPSWMRSTRSSTPGRPFGIFRKSPRPSSFWPWKSNGQWSVPTSCRSSATRPFQSSTAWSGGPERRRADELGALEAVAEVVERQEQVLRAGLGVDRPAVVPGLADLVEGVLGRHVDEVDRGAGGLGQPDHAVRRLALEDRVAGQAVADRIGRALGDEVGGDDVDDRAVLGVHEDHAAVLGGLLEGLEDRAVVAQEHARVGREELEGRDAFLDEPVHLRQRARRACRRRCSGSRSRCRPCRRPSRARCRGPGGTSRRAAGRRSR